MSYTPTRENLLDVFLYGAKAVANNTYRSLDEAEAKAQFDRGIAALIREAKAEAWGEGYDEWAQAPAGDQPPRDNPYREGSET